MMRNDTIARMTTAQADAPAALTQLTEDERLLRASVREFSEARIRPLVREMDEQARFPAALLKDLFDLGVMGIEIPETHGGGGGCRPRRTHASGRSARCTSSAS
jgi:alkylation response protein AidB-like acyl-CoA dehydrogenase